MSDRPQVQELFGRSKALVAMIHVGALPGTPFASAPIGAIVEQAVAEARLLHEAGVDAILIENMHDRPYLRQGVGPEIVAGMSAVLDAVHRVTDKPLGVQILAGANREALATAMAAGAAFIRAENFVFAHVADEGLMPDADAARLLRYRREIGAEHIRIFADIKKKHACHTLTADVSLAETAEAAELFSADGLIVTGTATGRPVAVEDVREVSASVGLPVAVGSGVTPDNLPRLWEHADVFVVGSFLKFDGLWHNPPDPDRVVAMVRAVQQLWTSAEEATPG